MMVWGYCRGTAYCWDGKDTVRAVHVARSRRGWRILAFGKVELDKLPSLLDLTRAAAGRSDTIVTFSGDSFEVCTTDLVMPDLELSDLKSALEMEFSRLSPVPIEQLQWGYRVLGRGSRDRSVTVRLMYMRVEVWNAWLALASNIDGGVDAILSAPTALDPVAADVPCVFDMAGGSQWTVTPVVSSGQRESQLRDVSSQADVFGLAGTEPLKLQGLELGPLGDEASDVQATFAPTVVLAMYASTGLPLKDRETLPALPKSLRPHRAVRLKVVAVALTVYCILSVVFAGVRAFQHHQKEHRRLVATYQELRATRDALAPRTHNPASLRLALDEMKRHLDNRRSATMCLAALNAAIDDRMWSQNFSWREGGDFEATLFGNFSATDLTDGLKQSPYFEDYREERRVRPDGKIEIRVSGRIRPSSVLEELHPIEILWERKVDEGVPASTLPVIHAGSIDAPIAMPGAPLLDGEARPSAVVADGDPEITSANLDQVSSRIDLEARHHPSEMDALQKDAREAHTTAKDSDAKTTEPIPDLTPASTEVSEPEDVELHDTSAFKQPAPPSTPRSANNPIAPPSIVKPVFEE